MAGRGEQCWKWKQMNRTAAYPTDHGLALPFCGQAPESLWSRDALGVLSESDVHQGGWCSLLALFFTLSLPGWAAEPLY